MANKNLNYKYSKHQQQQQQQIPNIPTNDHIYEEINDVPYYNNYYYKIEERISPTSSIKSYSSATTSSTSSASLNMNEDDSRCKSIKRVRFVKTENNNNSIPEKTSNLIQFLTKLRNNNNNIVNSQIIELKELNHKTCNNSILKKPPKPLNDSNNIFYSFVPSISSTTPTTVSSSSSLKSERSSTISSNECINDGKVAATPEFDNIVEEFITRLMCKTKGNHNCTLCYKHKSKSFNDCPIIETQQQKQQQQQQEPCTNFNLNDRPNPKQFTSLPSKLKRNIDDRLSFRVTNLTIEDLKNKYHSKNTL
jgi:hypothetical protein